MIKFVKRGLLAAGALVASAGASAAVTDITAQITATQTDALAVAGGLSTLALAVWGANYIRRKFFGR